MSSENAVGDAPDTDYLRYFQRYFHEHCQQRIKTLLRKYDPSENRSVTIDYEEVCQFASSIVDGTVVADDIVDNPEAVLGEAKTALVEYLTNDAGGQKLVTEVDNVGATPMIEDLDDIDWEKLRVNVVNSPVTKIRNLRSTHIDKLVTISGKITRATDTKTWYYRSVFRCTRCHTLHEIEQPNRDEFREPSSCKNADCDSRNPRFNNLMDHPETKKKDTQTLKIKEHHEQIEGTEQPKSADVFLTDDLAGVLTPGDRVEISGVYTSIDPTVADSGRAVTDQYIECRGFETDRDKNLDEITFTPEEELLIEAIATEPPTDDELDEMVEQLIQKHTATATEELRESVKEHLSGDPFELTQASMAPSIHGYDQMKKAMVFLLFGGSSKHPPDGNRVRGDIHMLFIGDPSTAKTQLATYLQNVAPRAVKSDGKGSSEAGLTAAAVQDDFGDGDEWTLKAGALVLADKGVAIVDELDKMQPKDRDSIHGAMEQQEINISKAGINSTMKTRCSVLATANPSGERFNPNEPIGTQFDIKPALMSRFDLIFSVRDEPDKQDDTKIARHILNNNEAGQAVSQVIDQQDPDFEQMGEVMDEYEDEIEERMDAEMDSLNPEIAPDLLRKYVIYARRNYTPKLSQEATEKILNFYVSIRVEGEEQDAPVPVTARKLEASVRLAEASARVRLSNEITAEDADRATELVRATLDDVGVDPDTGDYDVNSVDAGASRTQKEKSRQVNSVIREMEQEHEEYSANGVPKEELLDRVNMPKDDFEDALRRLRRRGEIYEPSQDSYRPT